MAGTGSRRGRLRPLRAGRYSSPRSVAADVAVVRRQLGLVRRPSTASLTSSSASSTALPRAPVSASSASARPGSPTTRFWSCGACTRPWHGSRSPSRRSANRSRSSASAAYRRCLPSFRLSTSRCWPEALPLHASAFVNRGTGRGNGLVEGWENGTSSLPAAAGGARYVGDEWVYVTGDGSRYGIPEPIRIWGRHLRQLPQYEALVGRADRTRLRAIELFLGSERALRRVRAGKRPPQALTRLASASQPSALREHGARAALRPWGYSAPSTDSSSS